MPGWLLRFDGLYEPRYTDHGIATYGFVVHHGRRRIHEGCGVVVGPGQGGDANVAEFGALIHGLTWLADTVGDAVRRCGLAIEGDNRLAIETVAGRWNLHSEKLKPLRDRARDLVEQLGGAANVSLTKVSRERNAEPDALTRQAYHEAKLEHPDWVTSKSGKRAARATKQPVGKAHKPAGKSIRRRRSKP
ncbi:MAG TPA: reverse transcriptase-like protein [Candidatus Thermoplasmatota archaeon]|nr:reverse transcriptase-like protein [Candidatus Thermoplasmatota archaeon]